MQIEEIEYTPNPNAIKFVLDQPLTAIGISHTIESIDEAEGFDLAQKIMKIEHVESVYFGDRWLTVTQDGDADWRDLMREIAEPIRETESEELEQAQVDAPGASDDEDGEQDWSKDDPRIEQIEEVLESEIMPYLEGDGGGLHIKGMSEDTLKIEYQGACGSCPASITGTLMAIERLIQREVDPDLSVEPTNDMADMGGAGAPMPYM